MLCSLHSCVSDSAAATLVWLQGKDSFTETYSTAQLQSNVHTHLSHVPDVSRMSSGCVPHLTKKGMAVN